MQPTQLYESKLSHVVNLQEDVGFLLYCMKFGGVHKKLLNRSAATSLCEDGSASLAAGLADADRAETRCSGKGQRYQLPRQ
jgi:hypothetical protein